MLAFDVGACGRLRWRGLGARLRGARRATARPAACGGSAAAALRRGAAAVAARAGLRAAAGVARCAFCFEDRDHAAFGHLVAELDLQFLDHARGGRRHFHRRLVRFQRDQALVLLHRVADGDQHFDDRHVVVIADVRNLDFDRLPLCFS